MKWYFHSESMNKELEVKAIFLDTNKFMVQLNGWGTECLYGADKLLQAHDDAVRRETKEEYRSILETVVDQTRKECAKMIQHLSDQLGDDRIMIDTDRAMEQAYDLAISAILATEPAREGTL